MSSSAAVLERELQRAARRPMTWALRTGFAALLLGFFAFIWAERADDWDWSAMQAQWVGQALFRAWASIQFAALAVVTPLLAAQAVAEEHDGRMLTLLAMTRLRPRQILLGKLLSRLLLLEVLVLGGLPVLAMTLSLGGVETARLLAAALESQAVILGAGAMAATLALWSRGPVVPAVLTWIWMGIAWGLLPAFVVVASTDDDHVAWLSPVVALVDARGWSMAGPPLIALLVAAVALVYGSRAFAHRVEAESGDGDEDTAGDRSGLGRLRIIIGAAAASLLLFAPAPVAFRVLAESGDTPPSALLRTAVDFVGIAYGGLAVVVGSALFLLFCGAVLGRLGRRGPKRAPPVFHSLQEMDLYATSMAARPQDEEARLRRRAARMPWLREVWSNPVAWREIATRAHGGIVRWAGRVYILSPLAVLGLFGLPGFSDDGDLMGALAFMSLLTAAGFAALAATSSMAGEKAARTLELLAATRMSPTRVMGGKMLGVAAFCAPPFLVGALLMLGGSWHFAARGSWIGGAPWGSYGDDTALIALLHWGGLVGWAAPVTAFLAAGCAWLALRARTAGRAWMHCMAWVGTLAVGPAILRGLADGDDAAEDLVALLNPLFHDEFWRGAALPVQFPISAALWALAAVVFFFHAARTLSERAARDRSA
jgi:ABC-type Na+ efflux pump permease subunit